MRHMLAFVIIFIAVCVVGVSLHASTKSPKPLDLTQVVEAIRQVEHWNGEDIGAAGERGPWQFTRETWLDFSKKPFWWASSHKREHKEEQHRVALAYITWIQEHLVNIPLKERAYAVALVYTCGYSAVKRGHISREKRDYAQRAQNIYDELTGR
jgi:hypothetical protein